MPIETGSGISDLDETWPLSGDPILEGDDHIRLLKNVLKTQFPGDAGQGFAIPITATEEELNFLAGVVSNIQAQLDVIGTNTTAIVANADAIVLKESTIDVDVKLNGKAATVSTDSVFGGFKHTFVGGVLNLITV